MFTPFAFVKSAGGIDPDAQAFINAAGISGSNATAVNTLVLDLKSYGIWTELQAIWPLVGGTSDSTKWNLKDPQDTNAAYRMGWTGTGWTFSSNGVQQSDSGTTHGNTYYAQNTNNNTVGMSMGVYINAGTNATGYDLGVFDSNDIMIAAGYGNNIFYVNYNGTSYITTSAFTMPNGFFASNNDGTTTIGYRNGSNVASGAEARVLTAAGNLYLGNRNGGVNEPTDRRYAFAFMGKSLTGTQHSNLYTAVQAFNTTLGRQV